MGMATTRPVTWAAGVRAAPILSPRSIALAEAMGQGPVQRPPIVNSICCSSASPRQMVSHSGVGARNLQGYPQLASANHPAHSPTLLPASRLSPFPLSHFHIALGLIVALANAMLLL